MSNDTDDPDPEELLQQSKTQRRTSTEPAARETASDDRPSLTEAVAGALADLESGELNSTFGFRDEWLVAVLVGLERSGELSTLVAESQAALDRDVDASDPSRSQAAALLMRLGLESLDSQLPAEAREGYKLHHDQKAESL